jgi:hypothetical protein
MPKGKIRKYIKSALPEGAILAGAAGMKSFKQFIY